MDRNPETTNDLLKLTHHKMIRIFTAQDNSVVTLLNKSRER